jgi:hypothetical protein
MAPELVLDAHLVSCSILFFALHFVRAHTHAQVPECLGLGRPTCSVPYLISVVAALCTNPSGCCSCQLVTPSSSPRRAFAHTVEWRLLGRSCASGLSCRSHLFRVS